MVGLASAALWLISFDVLAPSDGHFPLTATVTVASLSVIGRAISAGPPAERVAQSIPWRRGTRG